VYDLLKIAWQWILDNKEWLFSGGGIVLITSIIALMRGKRTVVHKIDTPKSKPTQKDRRPSIRREGKDYWQGITPEGTKYETEVVVSDSIPVSFQTFSFEYGPRGHVKELSLLGSSATAEIQFDCQITNPYKAMFSGGDYALNFLCPKFLVQARTVLENYSLTNLRKNREEVAKDIVSLLKQEFESYGVELQAVRIGAVQKIATPN